MGEILELRRGPERRKTPRGGRRAGDQPGFAPLVLMVGNDEGVIARSETVLARLHFGVSISRTVEEALGVLPDLRPDIIVAPHADSARIRLEAPQHVPVVSMEGHAHDNPEALVDEIRRALRLRRSR